jgi:hypothetical protein
MSAPSFRLILPSIVLLLAIRMPLMRPPSAAGSFGSLPAVGAALAQRPTEMREAGQIPFEWIADNTRWMRKPATFTGLESCLSNTSKFYRRDLWVAMPVYVEIWCEKDALAGVPMEETEIYDVPLMIARGYASLTFLHSAAIAIRAQGKAAFSLPA